MGIKFFDYILDSVKDDDLRGYYNYRKCTEAGKKRTYGCTAVRTRYCGKDKNKLLLQNVKCSNNSV
jgi:hypothetical protein